MRQTARVYPPFWYVPYVFQKACACGGDPGRSQIKLVIGVKDGEIKMRLTDPIADMLTRVRNALMAKHPEVSIPHSIMKEKIVTIFRDEGYIKGYRVSTVSTEEPHKTLVVYLKYTESGDSVIRGLKRVSKPGRRVYANNKNLATVLGGLGNGVVSTSSGIKTVKQCLREKVGGEYLCQIW